MHARLELQERRCRMEASVRDTKTKEYNERLREMLMVGIEQMERGETEDADIVFERLLKKYRSMSVSG